MRPAINFGSFGGSWWDDAQEKAGQIKDSASELVSGMASNAGSAMTQGAISELEGSMTRVGVAAAEAHGTALAAPAAPAAEQLTKTLRWVGLGVGAAGLAAAAYLLFRRKK